MTCASTMAYQVAREDVVGVGGDGAGGEDVVDGGGTGGAVAGGEVVGRGWGDEAVPGREGAEGARCRGKGSARCACVVEVAEVRLGPHASMAVTLTHNLETVVYITDADARRSHPFAVISRAVHTSLFAFLPARTI